MRETRLVFVDVELETTDKVVQLEVTVDALFNDSPFQCVVVFFSLPLTCATFRGKRNRIFSSPLFLAEKYRFLLKMC